MPYMTGITLGPSPLSYFPPWLPKSRACDGLDLESEERKIVGDGENAQFRSYMGISQIVAGEEISDKEWLSNFFKKFRVEGDIIHSLRNRDERTRMFGVLVELNQDTLNAWCLVDAL